MGWPEAVRDMVFFICAAAVLMTWLSDGAGWHVEDDDEDEDEDNNDDSNDRTRSAGRDHAGR